MVEEVERASGIEIVVEVTSARVRYLPDQPDTMACKFSPHGAKFLIPTLDYFPDGSVLHELLHIRRFLVDGVPSLSDCDTYEHWRPSFAAGLTRLDNSLEHLIIVPEELHIRPDRKEHWERVMTHMWNGLANESFSEVDRQQQALINWVFLRHVIPDSPVRTSATSVLEKFNLSNLAQRFYEALIPNLSNKEDLVRECFNHLELPLEMACLEYIDIHNGIRKEVPLVQ
ncbi:hypothetical protein [Collimonas arenae]|uniref:hypothetical protein n=1 Tax=Collimonas arenae TaxID=279058 RepID=UPI00056DCBA4|nr:hypothetical protein [Collimonas arenae]